MRILLALLFVAEASFAGSVVSTRPIRSNTVLGPADVSIVETTIPGALKQVEEAVGLETRVNLYPGRPIHAADLGPVSIVDRNDVVTMIYRKGGLTIIAEGRALARAGAGESLRVMNIDSKSVVVARVSGPGTVEVGR